MYVNTITGATSTAVPKLFPSAEWTGPKLQQAQTTVSASVGSTVESVHRIGSQKAKVVTIEFDDEELESVGQGTTGPAASSAPAASLARSAPVPGLDEASEAVFKQYKKQYLLPSRLSSIPILANLSANDLTVVTGLFRFQAVPAGTTLYNLNDVATTVRQRACSFVSRPSCLPASIFVLYIYPWAMW